MRGGIETLGRAHVRARVRAPVAPRTESLRAVSVKETVRLIPASRCTC